MGRNIPTFSAARAFEAVARHGNLQNAADELHISPSAVSHQIKALETFLGVKLLIRNTTGLKLTKTGKTYAQDLSAILEQLEIITLRVSNNHQSNRLTINLYHSVADLWLVSELSQFYKAHPEIEIKLVTQPEETDLSGTDIDLAIRHKSGNESSEQSVFLFEEYLTPVCSPEYLEEYGPFTDPKQLLDLPLNVYSGTDEEWLDWFKSVGVETERFKCGLEVDTRAAALRAAREGLGFAMGRQPYIHNFITNRHLIAPFDASVPTGMSYFLLIPDRTLLNPSAQKFKTWLKSTCQKFKI